jgi:Uma2 family endonuclease
MSTGLHLTLDEYERMIEGGAFDALRDRRIELIDGELREMTPPGPTHTEAVSRITHWSVLEPPRDAVKVRIQDPIGIPQLDSAPQPDIVWAKPRTYVDRYPLPEEVLLLIEVADSSLDYDCGEKAELYAAAGIQDFWVVDLQNRVIHVFRRPSATGFQDRFAARFGDELRPLKFPDVRLDVTALLSF